MNNDESFGVLLRIKDDVSDIRERITRLEEWRTTERDQAARRGWWGGVIASALVTLLLKSIDWFGRR